MDSSKFFNPRNQLLIILSSLCLSGAYLWYALRYQVLESEIAVLAQRDAALSADNQLATQTITTLDMDRVKKTKQAYERQEEAVRQLLPADTTKGSFIPVVNQALDEYGLTLIRLNPMDRERGPKYDIEPYDLAVQGKYHEIGAFLTAMGSAERITRLRNFKWTISKDIPGGDIAAERAMVAEMTLQTFLQGTGTTAEEATGVQAGGAPGTPGAPGALPASSSSASEKPTAPVTRYERDPSGQLWQIIYVPSRDKEVRIPVTKAGRATAEAWLATNAR